MYSGITARPGGSERVGDDAGTVRIELRASVAAVQ
jgi:hypothetical protein